MGMEARLTCGSRENQQETLERVRAVFAGVERNELEARSRAWRRG